MIGLKNMIIIGGASRNVGKTELVCGLVKRFSNDNELITIKISGMNPGNEPGHGTHGPPPERFHLLEETNRDGLKDSSRMLVSGARRAFYLRTDDQFLAEAVEQFFEVIDRNAIIVAESITLRKLVKPGLFVLVKNEREESIKRSLGEVMHLVDLTFVSDGTKFVPEPEIISLDTRGWNLNH